MAEAGLVGKVFERHFYQMITDESSFVCCKGGHTRKVEDRIADKIIQPTQDRGFHGQVYSHGV